MTTIVQGYSVSTLIRQPLDLDSLPVTLNYTGSQVTSLQVVYNEITYTQTLTYTGGNLTHISAWVAV